MNVATARAFARKNGPQFAVEVLVNFVSPYVIYSIGEAKLGEVNALLASSAPPILWSIVEFARKRRIDAVSLLVLAGIVLSLLAFIGGGSARFLQFRENFVTVAIGLAFLLSAAIGRPLIYQLARASMVRKSSEELASFDEISTNVHFKRSMNVMTLVWGFGLIGQAAIACAFLFVLSIKNYLLVSPIVGTGTMGALGLWSFLYVKRQKARGERARAAEALAKSDPAALPEP